MGPRSETGTMEVEWSLLQRADVMATRLLGVPGSLVQCLSWPSESVRGGALRDRPGHRVGQTRVGSDMPGGEKCRITQLARLFLWRRQSRRHRLASARLASGLACRTRT